MNTYTAAARQAAKHSDLKIKASTSDGSILGGVLVVATRSISQAEAG